MDYLKKLLSLVPVVVDTLVPVGVGARTKVAVVACPVLGLVAPLAGAIPGAEPFLPLIPFAQKVLCGVAPAFAVAGLLRK